MRDSERAVAAAEKLVEVLKRLAEKFPEAPLWTQLANLTWLECDVMMAIPLSHHDAFTEPVHGRREDFREVSAWK